MKAVAAFLLALCYLAASDASYTCREGARLSGARQIDVGNGKVVATTSSKYGYFLVGHRWIRLGNMRFTHLTVGLAGMWGCDHRNYVWKYVCGSFKRAKGRKMKQVDAGGDDILVGATANRRAYCLTDRRTLDYAGVGSPSWTNLARRLKYISCGKLFGCWGVDARHKVYIAKNANPSNCQFTHWHNVKGSMKMIEVSNDGKVFGVNRQGYVFQRLGITNSRRQGTTWKLIPMCTSVRHVSYEHGKLWVVTNSGMVLRCT